MAGLPRNRATNVLARAEIDVDGLADLDHLAAVHDADPVPIVIASA